jgi:ADP-ribose pyrophosphatase YjhB (NUDIX family)
MKESASLQFLELPPERRWRQQTYPAPIVVALIRRNSSQKTASGPTSHYLLIKRNGDPYNGCWALVGGKWEFGEALSEAIIREVKEETSLDAAFVAVRGLVSERVAPSGDKANGAHFLLFVCELSANDGKAEEQEEGAIAWFTRAEIEHLHATAAIIPSDFAMISSFAEAREVVPHIEAEMRAPIGGTSNDPIQLLRFERINNVKSDHES